MQAPAFKPFIPPDQSPRELTIRGVVIGSLLGIVFAASSVYLALKVGLTVSASIPVAVLSITLFRWLGKAFNARPATILENNIVQTTGSAGESIAAGIAFTLPALRLRGFDMELGRILLVGLLGGLLGVLMMIPLRHGLMVEEHGKLAFPEGTACADVLIVGEQGGTNAKTVFLGFGIGFFYAFINLILKVFPSEATFAVNFWGKLKGAILAFEVSPAMLGVGYIIGPRVASNMLAGGALAFLVFVPLIHHFGDGLTGIIYPSTGKTIANMSPGEIRSNYILFIGAGAVATGGFIALARAIPTIVKAFRASMRNVGRRGRSATGRTAVPRTERDLSMRVVLFGALALALGIAVAPIIDINPVSAILIVLFGFFFTTVSARITGEIGSSSNPISGMTIATLIITCALFAAVGWTGVEFKAMALTTAALVCVAASNGGTIAQDLKTGFLVGATPRQQQISILFGVVSSAIVIGFMLQLMNNSSTTHRGVDFPNYTVSLAADAPTEAGPDGTTYRVFYATTDFEPVKAGDYLIDGDGRIAFAKDASVKEGFRAHAIEGYAATRPARLDQTGPDGKPYAVYHVAKDVPGITRGKYLVDPQGHVAFLVDPGVCGGYPWKLQTPKQASRFAPVGDGFEEELGVDRQPYRAIDVRQTITCLRLPDGATVDGRLVGCFVADEADGHAKNIAFAYQETPSGHYLIDAQGQTAWSATDRILKYDAPKAQLFRLLIDGTIVDADREAPLPWGLVLVGVFLAIIMELVKVSSLPFAVGLYLPISTSGGIFIGGMIRYFVDRKKKLSAAEAEFSPGMLMASGLIAGAAIAGVLQAVFSGADVDLSIAHTFEFLGESWFPLAPFAVLAFVLYRAGTRAKT